MGKEYDWRGLSRRGVLEVLQVLNLNGRMRFSSIRRKREIKRLCLASLTSALSIANKLGLIEKISYKIADDGLEEITEANLKRGEKPQATFYEIKKKGRAVLELQEKISGILAS